jgi:hypothetical protein
MKLRQIKPIPIAPASLICTCIVCLLCACGGGGDGFSSDTGSISFSLDWIHPGPQYGLEKSPSGDVCDDYLIDAVNIAVQDSSGTNVASASWDCDDHQGTVDEVPKGSGISLTIDGAVGGNAYWRNQTAGVTVSGGEDTNLGTITMTYIGPDVTPPAISAHYPAADAANVFLDDDIIVTFTEDVVPGSLTASSCTLFEYGSTNPVNCTISYDASTHKATINPDSQLASYTDYTVTITTDVQDRAGLSLAADVSWTFTTVDTEGVSLIWDDEDWDASRWN